MNAKVLVVDDEPAACEMLRDVLSSAGLDAVMLTNSARAAERIAKEKFDAIFLDLRMPSPDGVELTVRLRAGGINQKTAVVMITADDDPAVLGRGFAAGATFFMFKPIEHSKILRVVRASQSSREQERRRFQRVPIQCKATLEASHLQTEGTTVDLSLGGILIEAPLMFPVGDPVKLDLHLGGNRAPLQATGCVVRVLAPGRMGIEFKGLTSQASSRLQEFLLPLILSTQEASAATGAAAKPPGPRAGR